MEPTFFEGDLWISGMPRTAKFADLAANRSSRCTPRPSTTQVSEDDAKIWGTVTDVADPALRRRFADALFAETGFDLRGQAFEHFFRTDLVGAAAVQITGGHRGRDHLAAPAPRAGCVSTDQRTPLTLAGSGTKSVVLH